MTVFGDLLQAYIALELAVDAVDGPVEPDLHTVLTERAALAARIVWIAELAHEGITGVAVPDRGRREAAIIDLARAFRTPAEAIDLFEAQRPHAVELFERYRDPIHDLATELMDVGSTHANEIGRLLDDADIGIMDTQR